jgi:ribonuclease Z
MIVRSVTAIAMALMALGSAAPADPEIKVTLLGTGTPVPAMNRFGPSILVGAGGRKFLFDAGRGVLQRLVQIKTSLQSVDGVLLTHLHSDHVVGFPDLWLTGWLVGQRDHALRVWGPRGTQAMMSHLEQAYEFDIRYRLSDDRAAPAGAVIVAEDIIEGVVFDKDGLKITAFEVDHAPVRPAFGYRVDFRGRSIVLSGDTRVSQNLVAHAQGLDLLVHEVVSPASYARAGLTAERAKSRIEHHTTPEQAGEVFALTKPRLAVYSHIGPPTATAQDLIPPTRKTYSGAVEVGEDLMVIEVGETVDVRRPALPSP